MYPRGGMIDPAFFNQTGPDSFRRFNAPLRLKLRLQSASTPPGSPVLFFLQCSWPLAMGEHVPVHRHSRRAPE
jgi:hypothetical protein